MLFIGGLANVVKVFKMQQISGMRLERLRGGAQERLVHLREGQMPLIGEEQRRRRAADVVVVVEEERRKPPLVVVDVGEGQSRILKTPYKDVLVGQT